MSRAFLDANLPIYAAGRPHSLKIPCEDVLAFVSQHEGRFITSAEVLQELVHVYRAVHAWTDRGARVFADFARLMEGRTESLLAEDVLRGAELADTYPRLSARDLVHVAVMERAGATAIVTADTSFDNLHGIERLDPAKATRWLLRFEDES